MTSYLPRSWKWSTVGDVADVTGGLTKNAGKRDVSKVRVPLVSVAAVHLRRIASEAVGEVGLLESDGDRATLARGDLLIVEGNGSLEHIGRVALWNDEVPGARHQNHIIRVRPHHIAPGFVLEWLASPSGREAIVNEATSAAGLYTLSLSKVERLPIPIPPANEQRRIVAKLEALQARSRRAREALDAVPPLLEKLRQSILAAAFRGDLTKNWRAKHKDVEPASQLLERIRTERRKKWEESELAKLRAKGKTPSDGQWKAKYKEPAPVDATGLPELPEGWCWASLGELAWESGYGTSAKCDYEGKGVAVLRIPNIARGLVDLADVKHALAARGEPGMLVMPGDLLIVRTNGSRNLIGRAAVIVDDLPEATSFASYLIRFRLLAGRSLHAWVGQYWQSPFVRAHIEAHAASSAGQYNVSLGELSGCPVPVAPFAEQAVVVEQVERWLASRSSAERTSRDLLQQMENLDRATLAKAFRGELVPQDPNDEPAEAMLARVRAQNGASAANGTNSEGVSSPRRKKRKATRAQARS